MEILIILVVAFLVLGPDKAVKFGKTLGTMTRKLKQTTEEFTAGLTKELEIEKEQERLQPLEKSGPPAPVNQLEKDRQQ